MKKFELPRTPAQWLEAVMNAIFFLCGILAVGCVAVITIYMFLSGLPAIGKIGPLKFLFGTEWASTASEPKYGILPFVLSSIYGTLGASLIGVPVGLLTAVFLSKAAAPGVRNVVVTAVELLSGIPSVVFGLLGMQVLVPAVAKVFGKASGACLLSAIVVLSIMIDRQNRCFRCIVYRAGRWHCRGQRADPAQRKQCAEHPGAEERRHRQQQGQDRRHQHGVQQARF